MTPPALPDEVLLAIKCDDVSDLKLFEPGTNVEEIAQEAALQGSPKVLEWCYTTGWYPPPRSYNGRFFLSVVSGESIDIFQTIINHGWDINGHETESCGDALACAVLNGNYDLTKWLLEHGHRASPIDPYHGPGSLSTTVYGQTASIDMLNLLLEHGINHQEEGAGIAAAEAGNVEGLRILLDAGVNIEERAMGTWYPFDEDKDEPREAEGTALYRACRQGHVECARLLLERGANAHAKDEEGTSCLAIARRRDHEEIVQMLEEKGVTD